MLKENLNPFENAQKMLKEACDNVSICGAIALAKMAVVNRI